MSGVLVLVMTRIIFFFFKQKTAYEMRISDWSSDVCSSDLEDGLDQIEIHSYDPAVPPGRIAFPEASYAAGLGSNPEYACPTLRLGYESMVTPGTVYDYHVASGTLTTLKVQEIPSGYDAAHYATERLTIAARDGTEVPVSIVYPRGFPRDGSRPLFLYAYGAYGMAIQIGRASCRERMCQYG